MSNVLGFTLIELLVAISIIAVLSTVGITTFRGTTSKAQDAVRKQDLQKLAQALEMYSQTNNKYVLNSGSCTKNTAGSNLYSDTNFAKLITGSLPKDPKTNANYCYESADGLTYKLYAKLEDGSDYILTSEDYIAQVQPPSQQIPTQNQPPPAAAPPPPPPPPSSPALRVFVTKSTYTGNLGGAGGADMKCQQTADATASLQGKLWRAWVSTGSVNAKDRIADGKYVRMDGVSIASSKADLLDGTIAVPINLTEGSTIPSVYGSENSAYTWTGTDAAGNATASTCAGWDQPQFANATIGVTTRTTGWSDGGYGADQCQTYQRHLYCFEQPQASSTGGAGCLTAYQDFDNDGYTSGGVVYFCNASSLPFGYKSSASAQADCDDQNANAHPGQTQYFTTAGTNGSFDYDCSSSTQPQYPYWGLSCGTYQVNTASSINCFQSWACSAVGAATSAADCGKMGNFLGDQTPDLYACDEGGSFPVHSPEKVTLGCR